MLITSSRILSFIFFFNFLLAEETSQDLRDFFPASTLADTDGLCTTIVNNVSVITGQYVEQQIDLMIEGPSPLIISRSFNSFDNTEKSIGPGWKFNLPHECILKSCHSGHSVSGYCSEESGGFVFFDKNDSKKIKVGTRTEKYEFIPSQIKGLTNCSGGFISGKYDLMNHQLTYNRKEKTCLLKTGTGDERLFKKYRSKDKYSIYQEESIKKANGCFFTFEYDEEELKWIKAWNNSKDVCYGNIRFYTKDDALIACSSNGQSVKYEFKKIPVKQGRREKKNYYLSAVSGTSKPYRYYSYRKKTDDDLVNIRGWYSNSGLFLQNKYYTVGENLVNGISRVYIPDQIAIVEKGIFRTKNYMLDRVMQQSEPVGPCNSSAITYRFVYNETGKSNECLNGFTDVYNAQLHKTTYHYNKEHRIDKIEHFTGEYPNNIFSYWEEYQWTDNGKLISKEIKNAQGKIEKGLSFSYDENGNVLTHTLRGNLSGNEREDSYTCWYAYSQDGLNNLVAEGDSEGPTIEYEYLPGTNLLSARFVSAEKRIQLREFRQYNLHLLCCKEVYDDGTSRQWDDLSDVTERIVIMRAFSEEANLFGKPTVEEYYTQNEAGLQLLQKVIYSYTSCRQISKKEVYDANNHFCYAQEYTYDLSGRLIGETDPLGYVIERSYDEEGNLIREAGPDHSFEKRYTYDVAQRKIREEEYHHDGTHLTTYFNYNLLNQKTESIDQFQQKTSYFYDEKGCIKQILAPKVAFSDGYYHPMTQAVYDIFSNPSWSSDADNLEIHQRHTIRGKVYYKLFPDGSEEKKIYTLGGRLSEVLHPDKTKTIYSYDQWGNITKESLYDAQGNILAETRNEWRNKKLISTCNPLGVAKYFKYDSAGRLISESTSKKRKEYGYDTLGRMVEEREFSEDHLLTVRRRILDWKGRVISEEVLDGQGNLQRKNTTGYDVSGRIIAETHWSTDQGGYCKFMNYNSQGRIVSIVESENQNTYFSYETVFDPGSEGWLLQTKKLNQSGNITIELADPSGKTILIEQYDSFSNLIAKKTLAYSLGGKPLEARESVIIKSIESDIQIHRWRYNTSGRLIEESFFADSAHTMTVRHQYDVIGRKVHTKKNDGVDLYWEYDGLGNILREYDSAQTYDHHYIHDALGHPLLIADPLQNWTITRTYSQEGEMISESFGEGLELKFLYDSLDRPTSVQLPDESSIGYCYKGFNLSEIIRFGSDAIERYRQSVLEVDLAGRPLSIELGGKCGELHFSYNPYGKTLAIQSTHFSQQCVYSIEGNLLKCTTQSPEGKEEVNYAYDVLKQLISEAGAITHSYNYDSLGNRLGYDGQSWKICPMTNRLLEADGCRYTYDPNGNQIQEGEKKFHYDSLDRLVAYETPQIKIQFTYDAFHRRLSKRTWNKDNDVFHSMSEEKYLYIGFDEVGIVNAEGCITALRVPGFRKNSEASVAAAIELNGRPYIPIYDYRGNTTLLADLETGVFVAYYRYDAFGNITHLQESLAESCPWLYFGKHFDKETSFVNFGRRYYSPHTGRWITPDPAGYQTGSNGYLFVNNCPLTIFDLYGLRETGNGGMFSAVFNIVGFVLYALAAHSPRAPGLNENAAYAGHRMQGLPADEFSSRFGKEYSRAHYLEMYRENENVALASENGILNNLHDNVDSSILVSKNYNGLAIHNVHNSTHGLSFDIFECIAQKLGFRTHSVKVLVHELKSLCLAKKTIILHAHSQGALITKRALEYLTPDELAKIHVRTFGGAAMINPRGLGSAINFVSTMDPVPFIVDPIGVLRGWRRSGIDVRFLSSDHYLPYDHAFGGDTYKNALNYIARRDMRDFNI